ncbi:MAG TPA: pilus assembly protein PilP [Arenicellales bacterium]|nr:pilus assembly protein PilP [Arenicellales bacterium]
MFQRLSALFLTASMLILSGCADKTMNDLERFVENTHKDRKPRVEPLPRVKPTPRFEYTASELVDPFSQANLIQRRPTPDGGPAPDPTRRKEPLEQFPLDALSMVGTLSNDDSSWAIIRAPDGTVHRAGAGNYLGQNYGKIQAVNDTEVEIVELVPDVNGGWMERDATLAIVQK